jgi:hypothetical protein
MAGLPDEAVRRARKTRTRSAKWSISAQTRKARVIPRLTYRHT